MKRKFLSVVFVALFSVLGAQTYAATSGKCGSINGTSVASKPSANLCSQGTPGTVSGQGPWYWSCNSTDGGTASKCSVNKTSTSANGICGAFNKQTLAIAPEAPSISSDAAKKLCSSGTPSAVTTTKSAYTWTCSGTDKGTTSSCSAQKSSNTVSASKVSGNEVNTVVTINVVGYSSNKSCTLTSVFFDNSGDFYTSTNNFGSCASKITMTYTSTSGVGVRMKMDFSSESRTITVNGQAQSVTFNGPGAGECGSNNAKTLTTKPTTGLCNKGTAGSVTGTGPWNWTCSISGGDTAYCSAYIQNATKKDGVCGSLNKQSLSTKPQDGASNLCTTGTPTTVGSSDFSWDWQCLGINGGTNASCKATKTTTDDGKTVVSENLGITFLGQPEGANCSAVITYYYEGDSIGSSTVNGLCANKKNITLTALKGTTYKVTSPIEASKSQTFNLDGQDDSITFGTGTSSSSSSSSGGSGGVVMDQENVTCLFTNDGKTHSCKSSYSYGNTKRTANCTGTTKCSVLVIGLKGLKIYWTEAIDGLEKSVIGTNNYTTTIDGQDETVSFAQDLTKVTETVTCKFLSTDGKTHKCTADLIQGDAVSPAVFSCSGVASCNIKVTGYSGNKLSWKSDIGGKIQSTTIDGQDESISFAQAPTKITESVTCKFYNATTSNNECYAFQGSTRIGCKGTTSCTVVVSGTATSGPATWITWASNVSSQSFNTTLDGKDETVTFTQAPKKVSETVTCKFIATDGKSHKCTVSMVGLPYGSTNSSGASLPSPEYSCKGIESCMVEVSEQKGTLLSWTSDLGGKIQSSTVDGQDETISFAQAPTKITESVTCKFNTTDSRSNNCKVTFIGLNTPGTSSSGGGGDFLDYRCSGIKSCTVKVNELRGSKLTWVADFTDQTQTSTVDGQDETVTFSKLNTDGGYINIVNGNGISACNTQIKNKIGSTSQYSCKVGGGCSISGVPPTNTIPSANPSIAGSCIPLSIWNGSVINIDVVDGVCGGSHSQTFPSQPSNDLCKYGTPSTISWTTKWNWTCSGLSGGKTVSCGAYKVIMSDPQPVSADAVCGASHKQYFTTQPSKDLCKIGTASAVTWTTKWEWTCKGILGGKSVSCGAYKRTNGECGSATLSVNKKPTTNLCSAGTASTVSGNGPWTWTCSGINGGITMSCKANVTLIR